MIRPCQICGEPFDSDANRAKYCERCRPIAKRERNRRYEKAAALKKVNTCRKCGVKIPKWKWYCDEHRASSRRDAIRKYEQGRRLDGWAQGGILEKEDCYVLLATALIQLCPRNEDCDTCIVADWCPKGT